MVLDTLRLNTSASRLPLCFSGIAIAKIPIISHLCKQFLNNPPFPLKNSLNYTLFNKSPRSPLNTNRSPSPEPAFCARGRQIFNTRALARARGRVFFISRPSL